MVASPPLSVLSRRGFLAGFGALALSPRFAFGQLASDLPDATEAGATGTPDDVEIIRRLIQEYGGVRLGRYHEFADMLILRQDDVRILGHPSGSTIRMLSGGGAFDQADPRPRAGRHAGVYLRGRDRLTIERVHFEFERADSPRTASAILVEDSVDTTLTDISASGFQDCVNPVLGFNTCRNLTLTRPVVTDIVGVQTELLRGQERVQLTAIGLDDDRIDGRNSTNVTIAGPIIKTVRLAPVLARLVGDQCDGINIKGLGGGSGTITDFLIEDIGGEGIDQFAHDYTIRGGSIRNVDAYGIKLIHGARNVRISNFSVDGTGGSAIVVGGSNSASGRQTGTVEDCDVSDFVVRGVGDVKPASGHKYLRAAVQFDGTTARYQPRRVRIHDFEVSNGGHMDYVVVIASGSQSVVEDYDYDSVEVSEAVIASEVRSKGHRVRQRKETAVRFDLGIASGRVAAQARSALEDGLGEYDAAKGVFVSRGYKTLRVFATLSGGSTQRVQLGVYVTNDASGAGQEASLAVGADVRMRPIMVDAQPGTTIRVVPRPGSRLPDQALVSVTIEEVRSNP